jgi:Fasciclin domain
MSSAKLIRTDVLVNDGVVHVIDRVLVDTAVDAARASSA